MDWNRSLTVVCTNIDPKTTAEELADHLWTIIGLNVDPKNISVKLSGKFSCTAFVTVTDEAIVDLLNRNLSAAHLCGRALQFEKKRWCPADEKQPVEYRKTGQKNRNGIAVLTSRGCRSAPSLCSQTERVSLLEVKSL